MTDRFPNSGQKRDRRMGRRGWTWLLAFVLLAALPEAAHACPVCFDAKEGTRMAFLATTAVLSFLPLGMVAGAGLWLRKRARELDESEGGETGQGR